MTHTSEVSGGNVQRFVAECGKSITREQSAVALHVGRRRQIICCGSRLDYLAVRLGHRCGAGQHPCGVPAHMIGCSILATLGDRNCFFRIKLKRQSQLIFELLRKPTVNQTVQDSAHQTRSLVLRETAMLESPRHSRPRSSVSDAVGVGLDESDAPFDRNGIAFQEPIGKIVQVLFLEQIKAKCGSVHSSFRCQDPHSGNGCRAYGPPLCSRNQASDSFIARLGRLTDHFVFE